MTDPSAAPTALPARDAAAPRRALLLQGPPGGFWPRLGAALRQAGCSPVRAPFCTADSLFQPHLRRGAIPAIPYRGGPDGWAPWLSDLLRRRGITDILYYSDRHPYHRAAAEAAQRLGIRAWAVEFGYLRPDWITLERDGMGAHSRFPTDRARIEALAAEHHPGPLDMTPRWRHGFAAEAAAEVSFHLVNALWFWPYPRYRAEAYYHPLAEYLSWARRLPGARARARRAEARAEALARSAAPWFLVALQLESDRQIRDNAAFEGQREMIETLMQSFRAHAPQTARLVFKTHPLDNGLERWPEEVARIAAAHGLAGRAETLEGGPLDALIAGARGVIAANSTVGLHAIRAGAPVLTMGEAVYNLPGLTHQGPLRRFWTAPEAPEPGFADTFQRALAGTIQIRGSFYARGGMEDAAAEIARRIAAPRAPGDAAAEPRPPRLPLRRRSAGQ